MLPQKIWLSPPHQTGKELQYIQEALFRNWIAPGGEQTAFFEKALSDFVLSNHVVTTSSGTSAIHLALKALGIGQGDIVLCQSLTFVGSVNPVSYLGAVPVFIDSEQETWNICPQALEDALLYFRKKNQKPKAIIVVDLYGNPAQWDVIQELGARYEIPVLEDAAEALGSSYLHKKAGTLGDIGIYSFNGNKIITTSGGGAVVTGDDSVADKIRFWSAQSREKTAHYEHHETGYNYQMSNICAAIGRAQIERIEERVQARRSVFWWYRQRLKDVVLFQDEPRKGKSNRWLTAVRFPAHLPDEKERLTNAFTDANIETRPVWKPMHLQPLFAGYRYFGGVTAAEIYKYGLCLPSGSGMQPEEFQRIENVLRKCFE